MLIFQGKAKHKFSGQRETYGSNSEPKTVPLYLSYLSWLTVVQDASSFSALSLKSQICIDVLLHDVFSIVFVSLPSTSYHSCR